MSILFQNKNKFKKLLRTGLETNCSMGFYTKKIFLLSYLAESVNLIIVVQLPHVFAFERINAYV